jgi:hypothetical protein
MAFPINTVSTANLNAGTDDPSLAREDLLDLTEKVNTIISESNTADGVLVLDINGRVPAAQVPATQSPQTDLTLAPSTGVVKIQDVLRLQQLSVTEVETRTANAAGDLVFVLDGDAGAECLAVYDGTEWRRVSLGAAISAS